MPEQPLSDGDGRERPQPEVAVTVRCGDCGRDYPRAQMTASNWIYDGWVCTHCILAGDEYK